MGVVAIFEIAIIQKYVGFSVIIYYAIAEILLTSLYKKKLKLFFAMLFAFIILVFVAFLWELPIMFAEPSLININSGFLTGFLYFIPLPVFAIIYNIKFDYNTKKISLLFFAICVSTIYAFLFPQFVYYNLSHYADLSYFTTFIPRTICLVALTYACFPNVSKANFNIRTSNEKRITKK